MNGRLYLEGVLVKPGDRVDPMRLAGKRARADACQAQPEGWKWAQLVKELEAGTTALEDGPRSAQAHVHTKRLGVYRRKTA